MRDGDGDPALRDQPVADLVKQLTVQTTGKVQEAAPPVPEETIETVKEDVGGHGAAAHVWFSERSSPAADG